MIESIGYKKFGGRRHYFPEVSKNRELGSGLVFRSERFKKEFLKRGRI